MYISKNANRGDRSWGWFRLTETKGRTFEELDIMFEARLPTRKFKSYVVDAYAEHAAIKDRVATQEEVRNGSLQA